MSMFEATISRAPLLALAITLAGAALPAQAQFAPSGGGSYAGLPLYRALAFGGIDTFAATSPGFASQDIFNGVDYASNTTSMPLATTGGTVSANGATLTGNGWSADAGFMASRNFASIAVSNAQATDTYYMVAGQGGTRAVHLEANAPAAAATFTWHVTGNATTSGLGTANSRLDFGVTSSPGSDWNDVLFGVGETAMTAFGAGTYSTTAALTGSAQDLYLYFWSSAFTSLNQGSFANGSSAQLTADFGSTYVLESVQLFDALGQAIDQWSMTDLASNALLFDQSGRIAAIVDAPDLGGGGNVPEPATASLLLVALGWLGWSRHRRPIPAWMDALTSAADLAVPRSTTCRIQADADVARQAFNAPSTSSSIFLASPNSMRLLSL